MLVLTRRPGQHIDIGKNGGAISLQITILGISGNQVRVGVAAPRDISVDRDEITARKQATRRPHKP